MKNSITILIAEDDEGHAYLVQENLRRAGLNNPIEHFADGEEILNFLFQRSEGRRREDGRAYLLLLDVRMPKLDGVEVLRQIKADPELHKLPVIMLTTTDDPREVELCHQMGCNNYLQKPVDYQQFAAGIQQLGLFITLLLVPCLNHPQRPV